MHDELPTQQVPSGFTIAMVIVGVLAIGFTLLFKAALQPLESNQVGQNFPAIDAAGWINGPGPTAAGLREQIVVVDAWAYWCGPCRSSTPFIIGLHRKYQDKGVMFLGLTSEGLDSASLEKSRDYVTSEKIPWPNGYGAAQTLSALNVDVIPQFWIVDRQNKIVFHEKGWRENTLSNMEIVLDKLLKMPTKAAP